MDWVSLIEVIGSVIIVNVVFKGIDRIRYKKQNKDLKKDEVVKAEADTDKKQIDLGDLFLEKTAKWSDILEKNIDRMMAKMDESDTKRDNDWKILRNDIETIKTKITEISHRQDLEEEFLNGKYVDFLVEKGEKVSVIKKGEKVNKSKNNGNKKTVPIPKRRGFDKKNV
jgi:hypothetical protein